MINGRHTISFLPLRRKNKKKQRFNEHLAVICLFLSLHSDVHRHIDAYYRTAEARMVLGIAYKLS